MTIFAISSKPAKHSKANALNSMTDPNLNKASGRTGRANQTNIFAVTNSVKAAIKKKETITLITMVQECQSPLIKT